MSNDDIATKWPYSVKIEQSTYGARISVHAYAGVANEAVDNAIYLYHHTRDMLKKVGFKVAPEEDPKPKK